MLVFAQLMEDITRRRNWVSSQKQFFVTELAGRDQAPGHRLVSHDIAIGSRFEFRGRDLIRRRKIFGRFAVIPASLQCLPVGIGNFRPCLGISDR